MISSITNSKTAKLILIIIREKYRIEVEFYSLFLIWANKQ